MPNDRPYENLALITDLDGTLLLPDKTLSPADAAAISDFRAKGGLFSIATGRGLQATRAFFSLLEPDFPAVLYNGVMLYDTKADRPAYASYLPHGIRALLDDLCVRFPNVGAEVLNEEGVFIIQDGEYERRHLEITHVPLNFRSLDTVDPERCYKALFAGGAEDISRMIAYVKQKKFEIVTITRSHEWFLEILPPETNKGTALQRLRGMLPAGLRLGATGDFDNDTAMMYAADLCGCPANAQPVVREAVAACGGYISPKTCADGFFADWIAAFLRRVGAR